MISYAVWRISKIDPYRAVLYATQKELQKIKSKLSYSASTRQKARVQSDQNVKAIVTRDSVMCVCLCLYDVRVWILSCIFRKE